MGLLRCCISSHQNRCDHFVNDLGLRNRSTLFHFIHLGNQQLHGFMCNLVNLLSYSADRDNCLGGNWGIIIPDDPEVIRKSAIISHQQIQKNIGMGVIGKKDSFSFIRIFVFDQIVDLTNVLLCFRITVAEICKDNFVSDIELLAGIAKTLDTAVRRDGETSELM